MTVSPSLGVCPRRSEETITFTTLLLSFSRGSPQLISVQRETDKKLENDSSRALNASFWTAAIFIRDKLNIWTDHMARRCSNPIGRSIPHSLFQSRRRPTVSHFLGVSAIWSSAADPAPYPTSSELLLIARLPSSPSLHGVTVDTWHLEPAHVSSVAPMLRRHTDFEGRAHNHWLSL